MKKAAQRLRGLHASNKRGPHLADRSPADQVDDRKQDHRADKRIEEGANVERVTCTEAIAEQEPRNHRANDSNDDIENDALLSIGSHNQACKPAANATNNQIYDP